MQVSRSRRVTGWGLQWTGAGAGGWGELGPELSVCADPNRSGAVLLFIPRGCWDMCVSVIVFDKRQINRV